MTDSEKNELLQTPEHEDKVKEERIQITDLSLPKGDGSIQGLKTDIKLEGQKGTASLDIPFTVPAGRGREEKLILSYHSTGGNGSFGQGFSLNLPVIERKTDCGIPLYLDEKDCFISSEYGELLAADTQKDSQGRKTVNFVPAVIKDFPCIRLIKEKGDSFWLVLSKDGTRHRFGMNKNSRVFDPNRREHILWWKLSDSEDVKGNKTIYEYDESGENREISRIRYSNYSGESGEENYVYEIEFFYTENRTDPLVNYRGGFCLGTERLCKKAVVYRNIPERAPIREYVFDYKTKLGVSLLSSITEKGVISDKKGGLTYEELPPLTFSYTGEETVQPEFKRFKGGDYPIPGPLSKGFCQFADLYGEGISGILYHDDRTAMYYEPLGPGIYSAPKPLHEFPMEGGAGEPSYRLISLKGNGLYDMVVSLPGRQGFYEQREGGFAPFAPFTQGLNIDSREYVELADLQGDSLSHAAIAGENNLTYYPSMKTDGFKSPVTTETPDGFPAKDGEGIHRIVCFLDLFGDGLKHRVLVENGRVECYPSLGYGQFGGRQVLENPPVFKGDFDARRLYFADLNGSGTMDFIYVGQDYAEVFYNCSGKYFMEGKKLSLPESYTEHDAVHFVDITGLGYQSMVFTKMGEEFRHYFCDLYGGLKPYLLKTIDNHRGAVTEISYESSAVLCLKDKAKGAPWKTRTPFPVQVVRSILTRDHISTRSTLSEYHYRDSFYDAEKRRFRGFGFMECVESDTFEGHGITTCPKKTKTWYHNGGRPLAEGKDYYREGSQNQREDVMPTDRALWTEAYRALEGKIIREELYEQDGTAREQEAVTVREHTYYVSSRHRGSHYAGLLSSVTCEYDRMPEDARIIRKEILETDEFENVTREVTVYCSRKNGALTGQKNTELEFTLTSWYNRAEEVRLIGIKCEEKKLQLTCAGQVPSPDALKQMLDNALTGQMEQDAIRLFSWEKYYYWNEDQTEALALGKVSANPLLHHKCTAALDVSSLEAIYGVSPDPERWEKKYGYIWEDGILWNRGLVSHYFKKDLHFLLKKQENSFVAESDPLFFRVEWEYDPCSLIPVHCAEYVEKDCVNHRYAKLDYSHLKYSQITDRNGNITQAVYDSLGNIRSVSYPECGAENSNPPPAVLYRYDFSAFEHHKGPVSCMEQRSETHQGEGRRMCRITYFDGEARPVERRKRSEKIWHVYEKKIKNRGGLDVVSYSPYEDDGEFTHFSKMGGTEAGDPVLTRYDVKGRITRVDTPREVVPGSKKTAYLYTEIEYGPWNETHFNHHNTLMTSDFRCATDALRGDSPEEITVKEVLHKSSLTVSEPLRYERDVFGNVCLEVLKKERQEKGVSIGDIVAAAYETDIQGRPVVAADPRLRRKKSYNLKLYYDFQGNILGSDSADGGRVRRIFDCHRRLRCEEDQNRNKKSFEYDHLGRLTEKYVEGIGLTERIEYGETIENGKISNLRGHVYRHFDQTGVEISDTYDRFDRVNKRKRYFIKNWDSPTVWEEDVELEEQCWKEEFAYNMFGGERLHITPDGARYITEYNEAGQPESVCGIIKGQEEVYIAEKCYDASGLPKSVRYGNGVVTDYQFLKGGRELYLQRSKKEDGTLLQELRHYYDEMGNLSRMENRLGDCVLKGSGEIPRVFDYTCDCFGRLLSSTGFEAPGKIGSDGGSVNNAHILESYMEEYRYDWGNNLTELRHIAPSGPFTDRLEIREDSNRILKVGDRELSYDANGNQLTTLNGYRACWNWDNKLVRTEPELAERDSREILREFYAYDYSGKRTQKLCVETLNEPEQEKKLEITTIRCMGNYRLRTIKRISGEEEELTVCQSSVSLSLGASLYLTATNDLIEGTAERRFLLENHGASVCMELDEYGGVMTYEEYTSFGRTAFTAGEEAALCHRDYRFGGKEKDGNGLYYFETRYYDRFRFLSCDSLAFVKFPEWMSLNLYAYCRNNPEKYTDTTGEEPGRHFNSIDEAAQNFAIEYNEQSIRNKQEIGAFLYSSVDAGVTHYSYTMPFTDRENDSVNPSLSSRINTVPRTIEGILHSHANYDARYDSENFSPEDMECSLAFTLHFQRSIPIYVATPGGRLKKYTPDPIAARPISTIHSLRIPHDQKAIPGHLSCNLCAKKH